MCMYSVNKELQTNHAIICDHVLVFCIYVLMLCRIVNSVMWCNIEM